MQDIIRLLIERLSSIRLLAYVSADWGQLAYDPPAAEWPCALVDISQVSLHDTLREEQTAEGIITVTVADYIDAPLHDDTPAGDFAQEMRIYSVIDQVHQALQGFDTAGFTPLSRRSVRRQTGRAGLRVFVVEYLTGWTETVERPALRHVDARLKADVSLGK